jgi:L-glutamine---4-(methylsulfanyl)-2-oxobutanoate aminotransferase
MASLPGMAERTITINSLSKTYSVTGWRVGYVIASPKLTGAIRKVHDFLTVGAAAPLQEAGVVALHFPDSYYRQLAADYVARRDFLLEGLCARGFGCYKPSGAYYIMTDITRFGFSDDVTCARYLVSEIGVATVPGSSFYHDPALGADKIRFCFCKTSATLERAVSLLEKLSLDYVRERA